MCVGRGGKRLCVYKNRREKKKLPGSCCCCCCARLAAFAGRQIYQVDAKLHVCLLQRDARALSPFGCFLPPHTHTHTRNFFFSYFILFYFFLAKMYTKKKKKEYQKANHEKRFFISSPRSLTTHTISFAHFDFCFFLEWWMMARKNKRTAEGGQK